MPVSTTLFKKLCDNCGNLSGRLEYFFRGASAECQTFGLYADCNKLKVKRLFKVIGQNAVGQHVRAKRSPADCIGIDNFGLARLDIEVGCIDNYKVGGLEPLNLAGEIFRGGIADKDPDFGCGGLVPGVFLDLLSSQYTGRVIASQFRADTKYRDALCVFKFLF
jgi:hypothetical protein